MYFRDPSEHFGFMFLHFNLPKITFSYSFFLILTNFTNWIVIPFALDGSMLTFYAANIGR